ncbi:hypothetical protein [uncultured Chryseobacterium sp.]
MLSIWLRKKGSPESKPRICRTLKHLKFPRFKNT